MDFYNAEKQFNENFKLFANTANQAEKYNFYAGLGNLAKGDFGYAIGICHGIPG